MGAIDLKLSICQELTALLPSRSRKLSPGDYILNENPDVVIDIIDASNLERNLYLATQLRELDCKVLFALNMDDVARSRGIRIDADKISALLDVPVVNTVGNKNEGIDALIQKAIALAQSEGAPPTSRRVKYNQDLEQAIARLQDLIEKQPSGNLPYNARWVSVKLLEKR